VPTAKKDLTGGLKVGDIGIIITQAFMQEHGIVAGRVVEVCGPGIGSIIETTPKGKIGPYAVCSIKDLIDESLRAGQDAYRRLQMEMKVLQSILAQTTIKITVVSQDQFDALTKAAQNPDEQIIVISGLVPAEREEGPARE